MRIGSLCSGIGGLDEGVMSAIGGELAWQFEIDRSACKVLDARNPRVPNLRDLRTLDWTKMVGPEWGDIDVLVAGFPCQSISQVGPREGIQHGNKSGLWYDVINVVRHVRPRLIILENVARLRTSHGGRDFNVVHSGLAQAGYDTRWLCLRAADVGAPHRRERIFIAAFDRNANIDFGVLPSHERTPILLPQYINAYLPTPVANDEGKTPEAHIAAKNRYDTSERTQITSLAVLARQTATTGQWVRRLLPTPIARDHRGPGSSGWSTSAPLSEQVVGLSPSWGEFEPAIRRWETVMGPVPLAIDNGQLSAKLVEWMQGFPPGYVTDILSRRQSLKVLGNAVVPQQAELAVRLLLDNERWK